MCDDTKEEPSCNFCDKKSHEVARLLVRDERGVCICDECTLVCVKAMLDNKETCVNQFVSELPFIKTLLKEQYALQRLIKTYAEDPLTLEERGGIWTKILEHVKTSEEIQKKFRMPRA